LEVKAEGEVKLYGWRARIGLIVPSSNTTMEPEFSKIMPEGVSVHTARLKLVNVDAESLRKMAERSVEAAEDLATAEVDLIVYGCTTGSLLEGSRWEEELRLRMEKATGITVITTAQAVVKSLKALGARKISVATPYIEELNEREKRFLEENGFKVIKIKGLGIVRNTEIGKQPPWVAYRLALEVARDSDADVLFISCTNFRTLEVINYLEETLQIPVISSNTSSAWLALRTLGIRDSINYGKLLREIKEVI
jgi:maleate isomerase